MSKISDIIQKLESWAPKNYQESYDNSGLLTGNPSHEVTGVLITLDCIEAVIDEAIAKKANLIVAHHPIIFGGLKSLTGRNYIERTVIKAIKNDVAIYAIHTNLDNVHTGVNAMIAEKIGLSQTKILKPKNHTLVKLEFFVPKENTNQVLDAIHEAGAGNIGNYEECSFKINGTGTFKPTENASPTIGKGGTKENVNEDRVEVVLPQYRQGQVISALKKAHPYEEASYVITSINNTNQEVGSGMIGELNKPLDIQSFLKLLKERMGLNTIKYTVLDKQLIKKVAVCGGSGSFLLRTAMAQGADAFVTSDFKYHEFFDGEGKTMIADIGHYESEVFTKDLIGRYLSENFTNIATYLSEVNTNPVKYF